jgi:hypothetical protein
MGQLTNINGLSSPKTPLHTLPLPLLFLSLPSFLSQVSAHPFQGGSIHFLSNHHVVHRSEDHNGTIDQHPPIHGTRFDRRRRGKEAPDQQHAEETKGDDVDEHAIASQAPRSGRKRFAAEALRQQAADAERVGCEDAAAAEGEEGVQGGGGAEVDEGEEDGYDEGDDDGVDGDVPAWSDLDKR